MGINNNNLVAPQQQQAPIAENRPVNDTPEVAEAEPADQTVAVDTSTSSGLAFIRSFIMSFITSIVPDAPGL